MIKYSRSYGACFVIAILFVGITIPFSDVAAETSENGNIIGIPPELVDYQTVVLDAQEIQRCIDEGLPVNIPIDNKDILVRFWYENLFAPDYKAYVHDANGMHEIARPEMNFYEGKIVGENNSTARLTVFGDMVSGYVESDSYTYWIESSAFYSPKNDPEVTLVYQSTELNIDLSNDFVETESNSDFEGDILASEEQTSDSQSFSSQTSSAPTTYRLCRIMLVADGEYYDNGHNWQQRQMSIWNNIDGIFKSEVGIKFQVVAQRLVDDGTLSSTDSSTLLRQFRDWGNDPNNNPSYRDKAFLFSGKQLDGDIIGKAYEPGDYALIQTISAGWWTTYQATSADQTTVGAHEEGHNFNARHEDACIFWYWNWGWHAKYSLMWKTYLGSEMINKFSSANKNRIMTNAAQVLPYKIQYWSGNDESSDGVILHHFWVKYSKYEYVGMYVDCEWFFTVSRPTKFTNLFFGCRDGGWNNRDFGYHSFYPYYYLAAGTGATISDFRSLDSAGTWRIWPAYKIYQGWYGPYRWHEAVITVS
jgi:hypothetical protein